MSPSGYPIDRIYRKQGGQEMVFPAGTTLNMQGGAIIGMMPTTDYFVDGENGSDDDSGRAWGKAFETIQQAMDAITDLGAQRGRNRTFVAPYGYAEAVTTPTNAIAPFGQLIARNPTPGCSYGAAWIQSPDALTPAITVNARGWLIQGFEIAAVANTPAILLNNTVGGLLSSGTELRDNLITGWGIAGGIGVNTIYAGAAWAKIINNRFEGLRGRAITCTESGHDQPRYWEIGHNVFVDNVNHIDFEGRGCKESWIHHNQLLQEGGNYTALMQIDLRGGRNNNVGPGNVLSDTYDNAGGYYESGTDFWRGNHHANTGGLTSGTGEVNPT